MLNDHVIILAILLSKTHPVVTDLAVFVTRFTSRESSRVTRLQVPDGLLGPAHLVCHVQPQMLAWFLDVALSQAHPVVGHLDWHQWCIIPFHTTAPHWTTEQKSQAVKQGTYELATNCAKFVCKEFVDMLSTSVLSDFMNNIGIVR